MKKFILGAIAVFIAALAVFFVLTSENALVAQPKGIIAQSELRLIHRIIFLMLIIIVPTYIALFLTIWRYRSKNSKAKYEPEHATGTFGEVILWVIPTLIVIVMAL